MGWHFVRPDDATIARFLARERARTYSYAQVGATRDAAMPVGYAHDHNRQRLGHGAATFARACAALRAWRQFPHPWTAIANGDGALVTERSPSDGARGTAGSASAIAPLREGEVIGVLIHAVGGWWLNSARIVYVVDEPRRFGFAYGTLPAHAERGEERFVVEHLADDTVWYDLRAFSRPRHWAARAGAPLTRALQRRFARESMRALRDAVATRA